MDRGARKKKIDPGPGEKKKKMDGSIVVDVTLREWR